MTRLYNNTNQTHDVSTQQENHNVISGKKHPPILPYLQNAYLNQLLPQLIDRQEVVQLFYTPQTTSENARLIVHLKSKYEAGTLQNQKWVTRLNNRHNTFAHFFYSTQLHHLKKLGNPFIWAYCQPSALIYTNNGFANPLLLNPADKKKHRKKCKAYKEQFYHDHDLLQSQVFPLVFADCSAAVLLHYENLLSHNLDYLESLYKGTPTRQQSLNERITSLTQYAPQIQKYFVKKTANSYYLIDLIQKAKQASLEGECYFGSEHYQAFQIAEAGLFQMVENRFQELRKITKQTHPRASSSVTSEAVKGDGGDLVNPFNTPSLRVKRSNLINQAITTLQKIKTPEEIYLFHHTIYGETQTYYLLLIGKGFSNQLLKNLTAKLNAQTGNKAEFVLIAHTRLWIQEFLYVHQDFFAKIIKEENRIFITSPHHPKPHWEHPYTPGYPDLELYHTHTVRVFDQFLLMADHQTDNNSGVANLFALFFQTFCKTYLFATLSYHPNNLHSQALWQLCLYANPKLKQYEYLFNQLDIPFFNFLDHYSTIQPTYPFKQKQKTNILIEIADKLINELKNKLPLSDC